MTPVIHILDIWDRYYNLWVIDVNIFFWSNYFVGILFIFLFGTFITFALSTRFHKLPRIVCSSIPMLLSAIPAFIRDAHPASSLFDLMGNLQTVIMVSFLVIFFKDIWWKKALIFILSLGILSISEPLAMVILSYNGISFSYSFDTYEMLMHQSLTYVITLIFYSIIGIVWKRVFDKQNSFNRNGIFLVFPLSQLLLFWEYPQIMLSAKDFANVIVLVLGVVTTFIADIISFYVILSDSEKEAMKAQITELNHLREIEQQHFDDIEKQDQMIAKIRHDIRNQLSVISDLVRTKENEQAMEYLSRLLDNVNSSSTRNWCGNRVVNAVLSEKEISCKERSIAPDISIVLGEIPSISPVYLCSAYSNLLDNAIEAASKCTGEKRIVRLRSSVNGDYLQIKVSNYSSRPDKFLVKRAAALDAHGHGQEILRDIASKYNGSFMTDWKDGIYSAVLILDTNFDSFRK